MAIDISIPSQVKSYANLAGFPISGSLKTIYIAEDTNKTYRWTGTTYVEISATAASTWGAIGGTLSNQTDLQTALNSKENTITAGTTSQYYRGDKTFQTLDKTAVGLSNVDNTSDANKPVSTATQTALNAKQDTLVSGTNIKTVNSTSLLGTGDVSVGVTSVTGTSPISSSGGATPAISIATANTSTTGALSSTDWNTFNNKQNALTLTTTGTSGEATLVGSTLNIPQYSGSGLKGMNNVLGYVPSSSFGIYPAVTGASIVTVPIALNTMYTYPFIPNVSKTSATLRINVTVLGAGANARIIIYSDSNGFPSSKLYESTNIDCSTVGIKTVTTAFTFTAGTTYWVGLQTSGAVTVTAIASFSLIPLNINSSFQPMTSYINNSIFGSAPDPYVYSSQSAGNVPLIAIF